MQAEESEKQRRSFRIVKPRPYPTSVEREIRNDIGRQLRAVYGDPADAPMPENIVQLLHKLEAAHSR